MLIFHHTTPETVKSPLIRQTSWRRLGRDPRVDWIFMILLWVVGVGIFSVVGLSMYFTVSDQFSNQDTASTVRLQTLDTKALAVTLGKLNARATTHAAAVKGIPIPSDPSL